MASEVTCRDIDTGQTQVVVIEDDYVLIVDGSCYLDSSQTYSNGTHVMTVKGRKETR